MAADPVGIADIAGRLGRPRQTVKQWNGRGWLPPPKWHASGLPLWEWREVERHLRKTGRIATAPIATAP